MTLYKLPSVVSSILTKPKNLSLIKKESDIFNTYLTQILSSPLMEISVVSSQTIDKVLPTSFYLLLLVLLVLKSSLYMFADVMNSSCLLKDKNTAFP